MYGVARSLGCEAKTATSIAKKRLRNLKNEN